MDDREKRIDEEWEKREDDFFTSLLVFIGLFLLLLFQYLRPIASPFFILFLFVPFLIFWFSCIPRWKRHLTPEEDRRCGNGQRKRIPGWVWLLVAAALFCVLVNFIICTPIIGNGKHREIDGAYFRWENGQQIEITKAEYDYIQRAESRFFTGHILLMSAAPLLFFASRRMEKKEGQKS